MVLVLFLSVTGKIPGKYIQRRRTDSLKIPKYLPHTITFPLFPSYRPQYLKRLKTNLIHVLPYNFTLINGIVQATSATWYEMDGPRFESRGIEIFRTRPDPGAHKASNTIVSGSLSRG